MSCYLYLALKLADTHMSGSRIILCVGFVLFVSCNTRHINNTSLESILSSPSKTHVIYLSELSSCSDSVRYEIQKYSQKNTDVDFSVLDCGIPDNLPLLYSMRITDIPSIIYISEDRKEVRFLQSYSQLDSIQAYPNSYKKSFFDQMRLHNAISKKDTAQCRLLYSKLEQEDFYSYYLVYKSHLMLGDICSDSLVTKAIDAYVSHPDDMTKLLFKDLLDNSHSECPVAVCSPSSFELSEVVADHVYVVESVCTNYSAQSLVILQAILSCSCLSVDCPKIVDPYSSVQIKITYKPEGKPVNQYFERQIHLYTNTQAQIMTLNICGTF